MVKKKRKRVRLKVEKQELKKRLIGYLGTSVLVICFLISLFWMIGQVRMPRQKDLSEVIIPEWIEQHYIRRNRYSRPGNELKRVNGIVIHYVANAGTSAAQNRNYFDSLADQTGLDKVSVSSHFIIGLDGEIIQCLPLDEIAYASNDRNGDTIAIECCHPDQTGEFTDATYQSLIQLTAWLSSELNIKEKQIIRHFDVTGKACPLYFVNHEEAWKKFKKEVKKRRAEIS